MINIKNLQYTRLKTYAPFLALCTNSGTIEQTTKPTAFPYMTFVQMDNTPYAPSIDSDSKENHVQPMIQIDVYTSNSNMYQAEQIIEKADDLMQADGWQRIFGPKPMPSMSVDVARQTARYQAIVKQNSPNNFTVI